MPYVGYLVLTPIIYRRPPTCSSAALGGFHDPVAIYRKNACRLQGRGEGEKKYSSFANNTIDSDCFVEGLRQEGFRTWHDSSGVHRQEAALVGYKDGVVHLSSPDGMLEEISEDKLSRADITYLRSQVVYETAPLKQSSFVRRLFRAFKKR